jgi:glyoxylase-like metal-dependent hydrolase (beta-lactamase superfamily II)
VVSANIQHHHEDHAGGNVALLKQFPHLRVFGGAGDAAAAVTHGDIRPELICATSYNARSCVLRFAAAEVKDESKFMIGNLEVTVLHTPCHTKVSCL